MKRTINLIVVHHSAGNINDDVEIIRKEHLKRGWQDIGYHWVILHPDNKNYKFNSFKDLIKKGRDESLIGAHCLNFNRTSIGICVVGNFEEIKTHDLQVDALRYQLKLLSNKYLVKLDQIKGHKDLMATLCPGKNLYERLLLLKREFSLKL